jgi:hypothetical protein
MKEMFGLTLLQNLTLFSYGPISWNITWHEWYSSSECLRLWLVYYVSVMHDIPIVRCILYTWLSSSGDRFSLLQIFFCCLLLLIIIIIYFNCKYVFTRWQWYYNKTQHTNNTPHSNKHSTQNYTNNKGHTTHNECNANTITTTII